jgi:3-hydroxybutyryl-CoA dehydrogenase
MSRPFNRIGVVGTGAMGRGIAQVFAVAGFPVVLHDADPAAAAAALTSLRDTLAMLVDKGRLKPEAARAAAAAVTTVDGLSGLAGCDLVIEAIVETLDAKRRLFENLEAVLDDETVLASNTSSLSITVPAASCRRPQRVAGYHFFNPVPLMKVVEVIAAPRTETAVIERLCMAARAAGHTPVIAQDTPGFIVNHAGRGFGTEALRVLGERVAPHHVIDRIMREQVSFGGLGFRLGPFELLDLTGLDVSHPVMESIYHQYYEEPRYRPSVIGANRVAAGLFGRKSGEGFYGHQPDAVTPDEQRVSGVDVLPRVWVAPGAAREPLIELAVEAGAPIDAGSAPAGDSLLLVAPLGLDATTTAVDLGLDARRTVAVDTLFPFALRACKRRTMMTTPATDPALRDAAHTLLACDGAAVAVLRDSPGFVAQRIVAMIVAIGCEIAQQGIASPADIDIAVRLGLGYPAGPLAMGDQLGAATVDTLLANIHRVTGDPRYRPSLWLRRRALLGLSLLGVET